jgi:hypothetical protein
MSFFTDVEAEAKKLADEAKADVEKVVDKVEGDVTVVEHDVKADVPQVKSDVELAGKEIAEEAIAEVPDVIAHPGNLGQDVKLVEVDAEADIKPVETDVKADVKKVVADLEAETDKGNEAAADAPVKNATWQADDAKHVAEHYEKLTQQSHDAAMQQREGLKDQELSGNVTETPDAWVNRFAQKSHDNNPV